MLNNKPVPANLVDRNTIDQLNKVIPYARYAAVRGPLSHSFLEAIGVNTAKVHISGDPAFVGINWGAVQHSIYRDGGRGHGRRSGRMTVPQLSGC